MATLVMLCVFSEMTLISQLLAPAPIPPLPVAKSFYALMDPFSLEL